MGIRMIDHNKILVKDINFLGTISRLIEEYWKRFSNKTEQGFENAQKK